MIYIINNILKMGFKRTKKPDLYKKLNIGPDRITNNLSEADKKELKLTPEQELRIHMNKIRNRVQEDD